MVAPVTAETLVAVRLLNVATPAAAVAVGDGPPSVQLPEPTAAVTTAELPVSALPYWSVIFTTGWMPKVPPLYDGAVGCVVIIIFAAAPMPIV